MKRILLFIFVLLGSFNAQSQWWPEVRVTYDPFASTTSLKRCVASCRDTVNVAWYEHTEGENAVIHYTRSTDAGLNWEAETQLTDGTYNAIEPSIGVSGLTVHLVWIGYANQSNDFGIFYMRSADGGNTWDDAVQLTNYSGIKWYPEITVSGNFVHIVWYDQCNDEWEVFYMRSADNGTTWDEKTRLTNEPAHSVFTSIAAAGTFVHVAWYDERDGNREIYYKHSTDAGISWGEDTRLTYSDGMSRFPEIAVSGPYVQIVYQDNSNGPYEIYSIRSTNEGLSWGEKTLLTNEAVSSEHASIAICGPEIHVVWQDLQSGVYQIFYKSSTDGGLSWGEDERLINTLYNAYYPSLAFSGEWLHVVWYDERDGNDEVYCKNKYLESMLVSQFSISPETIVLDTVYTGGYTMDSLQIYNYGINPLLIDSVFIEPPFSVSRDKNTWTNVIRNIEVPSYNPFSRTNIYARFYGAETGFFRDSISMVIEDSVYIVDIEGTCRETPGIINETERFPARVYPNPVLKEARISYLLQNTSNITLDVFDSKGISVDRMVIENQLQGSNTITWHRNDLPPGLYFFRLNDGNRSAYGKIILVNQ
jgi:hypothetical protein